MAGQYSIYKNTDNDGYEMKYYNPINIPFDSTSDYEITIPEKYDQKPGNMAYDLYGTPRLYWIFAYFNSDIIEDPIFGFKTGITIRVPSKQRLMTYF